MAIVPRWMDKDLFNTYTLMGHDAPACAQCFYCTDDCRCTKTTDCDDGMESITDKPKYAYQRLYWIDDGKDSLAD